MAQKEDSCTVGIVTFNPDAIRLKANIDNILKNTTKTNIVVADNGSKNIDEIKNIIASNPQILLLPLNENKGIAFALNRIFEKAIEQHHDWVLTLDQDSVAQPNLIDVLISYKQKQGVGILCPRIEDRNMGRQYATNTYSVDDIEMCVTSGNLVNVESWKSVQGYNESLFIDGVDFDFCIKLRAKGYKILRLNSVYILHEVGHGHLIHIFGRNLAAMNHSHIRLYYIVRNYLYLGKQYQQKKKWVSEVAKRMFIVTCFEHNRLKKWKYMLKGVIDFKKNRFGKIR